jgi:hypothetical protein
MQDLFASSFAVSSGDIDQLFVDVAATVSSWAARRTQEAPPDVLDGSGERDVGPGYHMQWLPLAVPGRTEQALEVILRHPDPQVEGREWRTVVDVCRRDESIGVTIRVSREAIELRMTPAALTTLRRPALVPQLLNTYRCSAGGLDLSAEPSQIHVTGISDFIDGVLGNPDRALPVVVVAPHSALPSAPDLRKVTDELAGLAHVAGFGGHLAWLRFREEIGGGLFVPPGGARIYWPGFGGREDQLIHRYWTARGIAALREPFDRALFATLTRISVHAVPRDPLPAELRRTAAEWQLRELRAAGRSDAELLELFADENETLGSRVEALEAQVAELERELAIHRQNYAAMSTALTASADDEADEQEILNEASHDEVDSMADLVDSLQLIESPSFLATSAARESALQSGYRDPARMWQHLESLAEGAKAWAEVGGAVGKDLKTWFSDNYGIEIALFDSTLGPAGRFLLEGKEYSREPHVKVDDYKNPAECGRIYFAYVADERRFIVDHIGLHL